MFVFVVNIIILVIYFKKLHGLKKESKVLEDVILFRPNPDCVSHLYNKACSSPFCSHITYNRIREYLVSGRKSLDICMHLVYSWNLLDIITERFRNGIEVRVITDNYNTFEPECRMLELYKAEIPVRLNRNPKSLMHTKFILIDNEILIVGSLNWTENALSMSWENVLVTTSPNIVKQHSDFFKWMWKEFSSLRRGP